MMEFHRYWRGSWKRRALAPSWPPCGASTTAPWLWGPVLPSAPLSAESRSRVKHHPDGTTDPGPAVAQKAGLWRGRPELPLAGPTHWTTWREEEVEKIVSLWNKASYDTCCEGRHSYLHDEHLLDGVVDEEAERLVPLGRPGAITHLWKEVKKYIYLLVVKQIFQPTQWNELHVWLLCIFFITRCH